MFKFSDSFYKSTYKLKDYFLRIFWKFQLGKLGHGSFIRSRTRILGNPRRIKIGEKIKIYENCIIAIGKGEITIGNSGLIGVGCYFNIGNERLSIGNGVAIAPYCKIFTYSHHYSTDKEIINCYKSGNITIEDNVLIGTNSTILPGITIGKNSIIAAASVVSSDIPPDSVYGGTPAKFIKKR